MCKYVEQMVEIFHDDLEKAQQALAACAYWAANGLHAWDDSIDSFSRQAVMYTMLENILKESKEYAISEPGCDNNIMFKGFEYTYTPVGGWPEPDVEYMSG